MITDKLTNVRQYEGTIAYVDEMLAFAERVQAEQLPEGRYDLDGDKLFALVQGYQTKLPEEGRMESHKLYNDLQYIMAGEECIEWEPVEGLEVEEDRTPASDTIFYKKKEFAGKTVLKAGMFGFYLPCDGHMPGIAVGEQADVKKIVFKIKCK